MKTNTPMERWEHPSPRSFWECLSTGAQQAFTRAAERRFFPFGAILCQEGGTTAHVIVIRSGWAKVTAVIEGRERIVSLRGPGDIVGERAAITRRSRTATVTALAPLIGLVVPAGRFRELVVAHPEIPAALESQEHERSAEDDELYRDGTADVERRMAYLLHELVLSRGERTPTGTSLTLPMSRREMAAWVDADTAEVNHVLAAWRRRGMVVTARRHLTVLDVGFLDDLCRIRPPQPAWSSLTCSILYTDVAGFSASCRDESDRQVVRDALYGMLRRAFDDSGISWTACYHEDRGDGVLIIVPPDVPTAAVADPTLPRLTAELRRHNKRSSDAVRIRLRVALHAGPVTRDREGLNGDAIIHAARMLEAPPLREALRTSSADLAFMASGQVFDGALRHGPGLVDPRGFARVSFEVKEARITAWMQVFGAVAPAVTAEAATGPRPTVTGSPGSAVADGPDGAPPRAAAITHFHSEVRVMGDFVLGDKNGG